MKKILLLFFMILCTSCNYRELNEISIITLLTIDKTEDTYILQSLVMDEDVDELKRYQGKGKTISNALNDLDLKLNKKIYLGHLKTMIISEDLAKEGLSDILNYFLKNEKIRDNFYLLISEDISGEDLLKKIEKEGLSLNNIDHLLSEDKLSSPIVNNTVNHFLRNLLDEGIDPSLNYINEDLEIHNIAIFKDDKLVSKSNQTNEINIFLNNTNSLLFSISCEKNITVTIDNIQIKNKKKNSEIQTLIYGIAQITEGNCNLTKKELTNKINKKLKKNLTETLQKLQENNTDIAGFGKLLFSSENLKEDYFKMLKINIQTNIKLNNRNEEYYE